MPDLSLTLDEVLSKGEGIERPFRCQVHDDHEASASVNVVKGVWFCYACHAKGTVDGKHAPAVDDLLAMLEPGKASRVYAEGYLDLYMSDDNTYWQSRFDPAWCWEEQLGEDPFTGAPVFPVRLSTGELAGLGRRRLEGEPEGPKYRYPRRWSASRTLGGYPVYPPYASEVIVLVEGYADMVAVRECGWVGLATYGAGLHYPQLELVNRLSPRLVLLGFDTDEAGERAAALSADLLTFRSAPVARVPWPSKDPAETPRFDRQAVLEKTVGAAQYGLLNPVTEAAARARKSINESYQRHLKDVA